MSTTAAVLRRAKALIDTPAKWTKGALARDAAGTRLPWSARPPYDGAVCFCAEGALAKAAGESLPHRPWMAMQEAVGTDSLFEWNDEPTTTHAEVMAAFDRAIAACEQDSA